MLFFDFQKLQQQIFSHSQPFQMIEPPSLSPPQFFHQPFLPLSER